MKISLTHNTDQVARAMKRAPGIVMGEIDRGVGRGAIELARTAKREAPKAFSILTNSIIARRVALGHHEVVAGAAYAIDVEEGRKPGRRPPIDVLRRWIRTKRIRPTDARDERGLAFLIARKIGRDGTDPNPFMQRSMDRTEARFFQLVAAARNRGVRMAMA